MSKEVKLIVASEEHCTELASFNKQLNDDGGCDNDMTIHELERRMHEFFLGGYQVIIFEVNGIHVGYTLVNIMKTPIFIRHFFVAGEFRRQGYGSEAFNKLIEFLGVDKIDLSVLVSNDIGFKFWESCGLVPYEVFMHYRGKA